MLSLLNSSTVDSDDEKTTKPVIKDADYFPVNVDEEAELAKLTIDTLLEEVTEMQKDLPSFDQATRRRLSELPREVQDPDAVTSFANDGNLDPLLNIIEFGSSELTNYNQRLEEEITQRKKLNLHLKLLKRKLDTDQKESKLKLRESREKLAELKSTQSQLDKRIQSLPDLARLVKGVTGADNYTTLKF